MTQPTTRDDVYIYRSRDPHTAIPDWLAFYRPISSEARALAHAIIVMSKGPMPPTKPEIAEKLGVDVRSVYRWLNELNAAGIMSTRAVGRRNLHVFTEPSNSDLGDQMTNGSDDQRITDRLDQMTNGSDDPLVRHDPHDRDQFLAQQNATNGGFSENPITDPTVGVGVGQHVIDSESTTTNRAPLKTALARWLKQAGMNAARQFDDPALDYWTYRRFVEDKRGLGWEWRQIVSTLREAPLERDPQAPPREDRPIIEAARQLDQQMDDLAGLDSTSLALARRAAADQAECAARAAGVFIEKGMRK